MADLFEIAGRVHSTSQEQVVTVADEIFDSSKNKKQSIINSETDTALADRYTRAETNAQINAKQYEIGAVEIDDVPRENSEHLIRSGAIYTAYSHQVYLDEEGTTEPASFDPQADTLHKASQVLSNAEKKQVRANLGFGNGDVDAEPTAGSENLVKSGGVAEVIGRTGDLILDIQFVDNDYYRITDNKFVFNGTHYGSKYAKVDLSNYIGHTLIITMPNGASSSVRVTGIGDYEGNVIVSTTEAALTSTPFTRTVEEGDYLYVSCLKATSPIAKIEGYDTGILGSIKAIEDNIDDIEGNIDSIEEDVETINSEIGRTGDLPIEQAFEDNYYYQISDNKFTLSNQHLGSKYLRIDLSPYSGGTLEVTMSASTGSGSTGRFTGIGDAEGNVISSSNEAAIIVTPFTSVIRTGYYLYISCLKTTTPVITVKGYNTGILGSIKDIEDEIGEENKRIEIEKGSEIAGEYYSKSGNSIAVSSGSGKRYEPIDLSSYIGKVVCVSIENAASGSSRYVAVCDEQGVIKSSKLEKNFVDDYVWEITPSDGDYLYLSSTVNPTINVYTLESTGIHGEINNLGVRVDELEHAKDNVDAVDVTIDYGDITITESNKSCSFTRSASKKISGIGNGRINVSIPRTSFRCGSIGIYVPWEYQKIVQIYQYLDNDIYGTLIRAWYKNETTGWVHFYQGKTFLRVNIPSNCTKLFRFRIDADGSEEPWEFYISDNMIFDDDMPLTPICIMYDGGQWEGRVIDNGVEMSLWELHRKYEIPYSICITKAYRNNLNPEVEEDLASGLASINYRDGDTDITTHYGDPDSYLADLLSSAFAAIGTDNRFVALAEHKLDEQMYRVAKQANVDALRCGDNNDLHGSLSGKFYDSDLFCVNTMRLGQADMGYTLNFPIVLWEHGVGIPPEQSTSDMYVDTDGLNTPQLFQQLSGWMKEGKVACLSPGDFIAYCKKYG